jgi:hypothetical protein
MGGSGLTGSVGGHAPITVGERLVSTDESLASQLYDIEVAEMFAELLLGINDRDTVATQKHVAEIVSALKKLLEGGESLETLFGGSVARHTHVDGLSDVDLLLILNDSSLANLGPRGALDVLVDRLEERFPRTSVSAGDTAVTVPFADMTLQIVPAIRQNDRVLIPDGADWIATDPTKFSALLTQANARNNRLVVPSIKLIKSAVAALDDRIRPSGYHVENLVLSVFGEYKGVRRMKDMLAYFFARATLAVLSPLPDVTGQSAFADAKLGSAGSRARQDLSAALSSMAAKLRHADDVRASAVWADVFGSPDE